MPVPTANLEYWYKCDENLANNLLADSTGQAGNALLRLANSTTAVNSNTVSVSDGPGGAYTRCLNLGTANKIEAQGFPIGGSVDYTFSAWVKWASLNNRGNIVETLMGGFTFVLGKSQANLPAMFWDDLGSSVVEEGTAFVANTWYHVCAATTNNGTKVNYYVNGVLQNNFAWDTPSVFDGEIAEWGGNYNTEPLKICGIRLYSAGLNATQVGDLYAEGVSSSSGCVTFPRGKMGMGLSF